MLFDPRRFFQKFFETWKAFVLHEDKMLIDPADCFSSLNWRLFVDRRFMKPFDQKNLGFNVILKTNADLRTMETSIHSFGRKLHSGGTGLFYYAGHGIQFEGKNFLIPIRANIDSEADIRYETVDTGRVFA